MIALLQRVKHANVMIEKKIRGEISIGILALIGVEKEDQTQDAIRLIDRILNYRIFADANDKMNLSLYDLGNDAGLLLVPQFTLVADTKKGNRPSFAPAAPKELGIKLFNECVDYARLSFPNIEVGEFGADMQVSLLNDGPVTLWLTTR